MALRSYIGKQVSPCWQFALAFWLAAPQWATIRRKKEEVTNNEAMMKKEETMKKKDMMKKESMKK